MKPHIKRIANHYLKRLIEGERILRRASGHIQWASGRKISRPALDYLMSIGIAANLDADLFGEKSRGQTIGLSPEAGRAFADPAAAAGAQVQNLRCRGASGDGHARQG
jgi:hypothetical protein